MSTKVEYASIAVKAETLAILWSLRERDDESWSEILGRAAGAGRNASSYEAEAEILDDAGLEDNPDRLENNRWQRPITTGFGRVAYEVISEARQAPTDIDAFLDIIQTLAELDEALLERAAPLVRGRTRNHIARTRDAVYPLRPDLARDAKLIGGWYVGINLSADSKRQVLRGVCRAAGLTFGTDVRAPF